MFATDRISSGVILAVATVLALGVDNIIRPVLIRREANLPILLILAGVIGGLLGFGLIGLFLGPAVLAIAHALLSAWMTEETTIAPEPHQERAVATLSSDGDALRNLSQTTSDLQPKQPSGETVNPSHCRPRRGSSAQKAPEFA